ncbi:pyridoxamine 5'-phosphate oxidase family protein [Actinoplanes sp. CA-030573]|uniref:pyridoxamine 5'-phosphate oxidase family protein n=1 Tax=Actinoplanes sp. CA-030573 TaxID=3239898 RepID=UPI003D8EDFF8
MGKVYASIDGRLREFLLRQPVFFVATAPSGPDGHVNVSPKGGRGCLAVLDEHRVAYLDYTGSGAETIAHLRENGRITLMTCAFEGPPKIVRLHGRGRVAVPESTGFAELVRAFPAPPAHGLRAVIEVTVDRISDSCGYQVPLMAYEGDRDLLTRWADRKTDDDLAEYRRTRNAQSIDGLPALVD